MGRMGKSCQSGKEGRGPHLSQQEVERVAEIYVAAQLRGERVHLREELISEDGGEEALLVDLEESPTCEEPGLVGVKNSEGVGWTH